MKTNWALLTEFWVDGEPKPGGSKTIGYAKSGKAFIRPANKDTKPWMKAVAEAAKHAVGLRYQPVDCMVKTLMMFYFPRPASHYLDNGELKPNAPARKKTRPDTTKLERSTEDALQGVIFTEDSRIVCKSDNTGKYYADDGRVGAFIQIFIPEDEL